MIQKMWEFGHSLEFSKWLQLAREELSLFLDERITVVTLFGHDSLDRSKGQELNDLLQLEVFPTPTTQEEALSIQTFFDADELVLYLVVNGLDDEAQLLNTFSSDTDENKGFFELLEESEKQTIRAAHFIFLISHLVIFVEPTPRLDLSLAHKLSKINRIRIAGEPDIVDVMSDAFEKFDDVSVWNQGRVAVPRFVFGFHRNVVRVELGAQKRREIYEKLEKALEDQILSIFSALKLADLENKTKRNLGYIDKREQFVHLLVPSLVNCNALADVIDLDTEISIEKIDERKAFSDSFSQFLRDNIESVRDLQKDAPTLSGFISMSSYLWKSLFVDETVSGVNLAVKRYCNPELKFINSQRRICVDQALSVYMERNDRRERNTTRTKAEHDKQFALAVEYLDSVLVGPREAAMKMLRDECDQRWSSGMRSCEEQSLTGNPCQLAMHGTVGDESVSDKQWELHNSTVTFISTCTCGRKQTLRKDPFILKEANYEFYHKNDVFTCCDGLERHTFEVLNLDGDLNRTDISENSWTHQAEMNMANWPQPGKENLSVDHWQQALSTRIADSQEEATTSVSENVSQETSNATSSPDSEVEYDEEHDGFGAAKSYTYLDREEDIQIQETQDQNKVLAKEHAKLLTRLRKKQIEFLDGVPHSLSPNVLPLFPSWTLTCIGHSSVYSHSTGLHDQPNFKIACEFLLPVIAQLEVDSYNWDQDMQYVNAVEGASAYSRLVKKTRRPGENTEKVKLFVGFDYECPRGHRFFVDDKGEPLLLPRSHGLRDDACREAGANILSSNLPLRRQCTCRKQPNQVAQLSKIHIVTPKAPVSVTIDPKIEVPGQQGYFHTGEGPLKLNWARYYILQLPFVYSGPQGPWLPPTTFDKVGTLKGNSIKVEYKPIAK